MDDKYIIWWLYDEPSYREEAQEYDDLTTAEKNFFALKRLKKTVIIRLKWGDVVIKEYRRFYDAEEDDRK